MAIRLTPLQYADKYRRLEVYLYTEEQAQAAVGDGLPPGGEWTTVQVHSYRINLHQAYHSTLTSLEAFKNVVRPHLDAQDESITVWVKTVQGQVVGKTYRSRKDLAENVNDPFYGKGSPEEVQIVLQLAVRYGLFPRGQIQTYCDNGNIGLDCNGFVGCYLRHVVEGMPWDTDAHTPQEVRTQFDANISIRALLDFNHRTQAVNSVIDVVQSPGSPFLLLMSDEKGRVLDHFTDSDGNTSYGHVMISEPGSAHIAHNPRIPKLGLKERAMRLKVVESAGSKGLSDSYYYVLPGNDHNAFHAYRGLTDSLIWVRLAKVL
ncbi:MAG TPA: hypothetical protein VHD15_12090 [Hyphomicrobiales bacterium]|nr:hypothetical protein [Hyphomicrobiales bacterium]